MNPDPDAVVFFGTVLIALISVLMYSAVHQYFKFRTAREKGDQDPSRSLGISELETLLRKVMAESLVPLEDRIENLEEEVRTLHERGEDRRDLQLGAGKNGPLLELPEPDRDEPVEPMVASRRLHSR